MRQYNVPKRYIGKENGAREEEEYATKALAKVRQGRLADILFCLGWIHADLLSAAASLKFDHAGHVGKQSMVLPQTDVEPWKELRASLAHDDRPGLDQFAADMP